MLESLIGTSLLYNALAALVKFAIASVAIGAALSALDIQAADLLTDMGLTPEKMRIVLSGAVDWALPHFMLGAMVIVPIWLVLFLLKPPGINK
ncbi:MAG: DUF6460 domain-containing protein [Rhodobiaceae bacterium]|nr:hypothetical protein RHODOSMS8_00344 [Rhodobiaceae bacterium]MCR9240198.1 DUF6460 domain-containing protein [Rhodobiaceae bacterium]